MPPINRSAFPGQYQVGTTVLHRLPAWPKLLLSTSVAVAAVVSPTPLALGLLAAICLVLYLASQLGWRSLCQDLLLVALQAPLVFLLFLWRDGIAGLPAALTISLRLALSLAPGLWLQRTTPVGELAAAFAKILPRRQAFLLTMSLRFLPILTRDAMEIYRLQRLRGARIAPKDLLNPASWIEAAQCLAVPLVLRTLCLADQAALAAEQRGVTFQSTLDPQIRSF